MATETIKTGWLKDYEGAKFAPKTISTQILTPAGTSFISSLNELLSAKQNSITGAASTITDNNLTGSRVLISDSTGKVAVSSTITPTELGYLNNVKSNIQDQLDNIIVNNSTITITAGTGLTTGGNFTLNQNADKTITLNLNLNKTTSLGTLGTTSQLYAIGVDTNGKLCVQVPWTDENTHYTANLYAGSSSASTSNSTSDASDPYLILRENSSNRNAIQMKGDGDTTVSAKNGIITISSNYTLPTASTVTKGGVIIGDNISVSSGVISLTKENVTTALGYTPPSSDTNTTYTLSGELSGNTFVTTLDPSTGSNTTATVPAMTGATAGIAGKAGLVPAATVEQRKSFLRGDGTWAVPTDTTYSDMTGATAGIAGTHGLVPAPAAGKQKSFLRGDGTWQEVSAASNVSYGTSSTAANIAAKVATITTGTFSLVTGARVSIKFTSANGAASPTLNVNDTGAKYIRFRNANLNYINNWSANQVVDFIYDGTYWQVTGMVKPFTLLDSSGEDWNLPLMMTDGFDAYYDSDEYVWYNAAQGILASPGFQVQGGPIIYPSDYCSLEFIDAGLQGEAVYLENVQIYNMDLYGPGATSNDPSPTTVRIRAQSLNAEATTPTYNGQIAWTYG